MSTAAIETLRKKIEDERKQLADIEKRIEELNRAIRSFKANIDALDFRTETKAIHWWLSQQSEAIRERDLLIRRKSELEAYIRSDEQELAKLMGEVREKQVTVEIEKAKPDEKLVKTIQLYGSQISEGIGKIGITSADISQILSAFKDETTSNLEDLGTVFKKVASFLGVPYIADFLTDKQITDAIGTLVTEVMKASGQVIFAIIQPLIMPLNAFMSGVFEQIIKIYTEAEAERWKKPFINVIQALFNGITYEPPATYDKAIDAASKYLSISISINNLTHLVGTALDSIGNLEIMGTKIGLRGFSRWAYSLNFVLGLNWLSWTVFSPLFKATVVDPLEQYYNQLYRSKVLSVSEAEQAFKNGIINLNEYKAILMVHGYNDDSIDVMSANVILEIVDRIEALEVQYADVAEDLGKVLTVTVPELEERIESLKNQIKMAEETINKEKEVALARVKAEYQPRLDMISKRISEIEEPIRKRYQIEIEKLEGILNVELEKIAKQKEVAKDYRQMYELQIKEAELKQKYEVQVKALQEKMNLEIAKAIEKLQTEYNALMQAFQLRTQELELKYSKLLEEKTSRLKEQCNRYTKQLDYYNTYKIPLLEKKLKRIEAQIKRLKEATTMSEPEDLLKNAYEQLKKKKQLVKIVSEEEQKKLKLQMK